ncbi:MAG: DUF58 domain-containing protein [Armatimonadetes bacterium]|nr:DUF58 domain-containing protein [Armatimonadota bacterium]
MKHGHEDDAQSVPARRPTPEALLRLSSMYLRARAIVDGHFSGQHRSRSKGASVEFADHREYAPGDDTRHLDWRLYARSGRDFVKEFDAETNLFVYLIVDISRSMAYPSGGLTKLDYAALLAAGLSYLAWRQRDAPGLFLIDNELRLSLPPLTQRGHLARIMDALEQLRPGGGTDIETALGGCAALASRRGLVVFISDLWAPADNITRSLRFFRHRGHDVLVFHVLHRDELDFPFRGSWIFLDAETGSKHPADASAVRAAYLEALHTHMLTLRDQLRRHDIDYHLVSLSHPFDAALSAVLARRQRLK